jgi:hypothetical protein
MCEEVKQTGHSLCPKHYSCRGIKSKLQNTTHTQKEVDNLVHDIASETQGVLPVRLSGKLLQYEDSVLVKCRGLLKVRIQLSA